MGDDRRDCLPSLVLASGSPQRQRLLAEAGHSFQVIVPRPHAECGICSKETPPELVARLACQKAADVVEQLGPAVSADHTIVACDTVVECTGQILGKPNNRQHARQMLELLRGREHHVYSGLCLMTTDARPPTVQVARTTLRMEALSDNQIEDYLASGQWEGKAGAFGYQDRTGWLRIVEGSESNVIGLPLELFETMLRDVAARVSDKENSPGGRP